MRVAFIGVGAIGSPMALRLLPHHDVTVFDLSIERVDELVRAGATSAPTAAQASQDAEVVIVMVATPHQLHAAIADPSGVAEGLRQGATLVIMSSVGVEAVAEIARRTASQGVHVVDCPVTGGVVRARTGDLTLLAGGPSEDIDAVRPVLEHMGYIADCGSRVGDGQAVKLVNQLLCSVHLAAAGEALQLARGLGLDPASVLKIVGGGAAGSFMLNDRGPRMLAAEEPPVLSAVDIFVKDSDLVRQAADAAGASVPLLNVAADLFSAVSAAGSGRRDDSAVISAFSAISAQQVPAIRTTAS